jgi:hypothetical protein
MNTALEYSTRVVQEGDRRCKKSTLNDLAYLTPLRIPLMNPVQEGGEGRAVDNSSHTLFGRYRYLDTYVPTYSTIQQVSTVFMGRNIYVYLIYHYPRIKESCDDGRFVLLLNARKITG